MTTIHIVSHTHWDREWYLTFQQFRLKLVRMIDRLLDLLAEDPDFRRFTLDGQMIVLEDYLEMRPERLEALRDHIRSGRILVGPWYIQPDEFLVSPESLIRNLLEGERIARRFGPKMMVGYTPDTFGHISQLPQILRGFGIQAACLQRGLADEPCELTWQAPDGSQVFLSYLRDGYGNGQALLFNNGQAAVSELKRASQSLFPYCQTGQILIQQGTDHTEAIPDTSRGIHLAQNAWKEMRILHSSLTEYLASVLQEVSARGLQLPVVSGELRSPKRSPLLPGVLSTRMWIKQRNADCETLLERWSEPFSTFATLLAPETSLSASQALSGWNERNPHPADLVRQAWRTLIQCHPHDSICGCSIDPVHQEMPSRFDQAEQIGEEIAAQSLKALSETVDTRNDVGAFAALVVFNPLSQPRTDRVDVDLQVLDGVEGVEVCTEDGTSVPFEVLNATSTPVSTFDLSRRDLLGMVGLLQSGEFGGSVARDVSFYQSGGEVWVDLRMANSGLPNHPVVQAALRALDHLLETDEVEVFHIRISMLARLRVTFSAQDVPACGYRTFRLCAKPAESPAEQANPEPYRIENERFLVEVNPADGTLDLLDKATQVSFTGLNRFVDGGDRGDLYNYCPPERDRLLTAELIEVSKPARSAFHELSITYRILAPVSLAEDRAERSVQVAPILIRSRVSLAPGVPRVDIHTEVDNPTRDHRLRVHFPAPFAIQAADYDSHFDVIHRPVGIPEYDASWIEQPRPEQPQRCFTDISNGKTGLMLAVRGLPEVEAMSLPGERSELALTLLRCTGWLSRGDLSTRHADAGPTGLETPAAQMPGRWSFDYAIIPHAGAWQDAAWDGWAFSVPLRAEMTGNHPGALPMQKSLIAVDRPDFLITAVKAAEDRRGWILRGVSLANQPVQVSFTVNLPFQQVGRVRLDETPVEELSAQPGNAFSIRVRPDEILTLKFGGDYPY